jgi:hypothetical protein
MAEAEEPSQVAAGGLVGSERVRRHPHPRH